MQEASPRRTIELFDAVSLGIGAIVGAGIYVVVGMATRVSGPAVILAIALAGMVSLVTAYSFVQIAKRMPKGVEAARHAGSLLSPYGGFLTSFLWLSANIAVGAVVSLGFGVYFSFLTGLPAAPVAVALCIGAVVSNLFGSRDSVVANNIVVGVKLGALLLFGTAGFLFLNPTNFEPFAPYGFSGVLSATALIFFAYGGFARITSITDEMVDPAATVPRAVIFALGITAMIYVIVAAAAIGAHDYRLPIGKGAYLADVISASPLPYLPLIVSLGAMAATGSVLLASTSEVSKVLAAMAKNRQLPSFFGQENSQNGVFTNALVIGGACSALLASTGDLGLLVPFSSFALLAFYSAANYSAFSLMRGISRLIPFAALFSCMLLLAYLPPETILVGMLLSIAATAYRIIAKKAEPA